MASYWLVVGSPEHWQVAFENGNIWGLQQVKFRWWDRLSEGDGLIFYVTRPVGGAIGLGKVSTKFKQDKPLWPREVEAQMRIPGQGGHDSEIDPVIIPKLIRSRFRDEVGQGFRF
jgi:hypothetical protein